METFNENERASFEEDRKKNKPLDAIPFGNNIPFETPNDSLMEKIVLQVEYLFSDGNILKDKFLLKHVRRNKEGYVSLKLISSLRKVKALSKDWRVVAYSLQKSRKLEMNDEKTKIRRLDPLPKVSDTDSPRIFHDYTVLLFHNIPGYWSCENVNKLLSSFRTVKSVVKINSGRDEMDLDVKRTLDFYGHVATFPFAVVKFGAPAEAANAILRTSYATSLIKLVPLVNENYMPVLSPKFESNKMLEHNYNNYSKILSPGPLEHQRFCLDDSYTRINEDWMCNKKRRPIQVQRESLTAFESKDKTYLPYRGDGPDNNRWMKKKFSNGCYLAGPSVVILRQPKGPDGTKGFYTTRITA